MKCFYTSVVLSVSEKTGRIEQVLNKNNYPKIHQRLAEGPERRIVFQLIVD